MCKRGSHLPGGLPAATQLFSAFCYVPKNSSYTGLHFMEVVRFNCIQNRGQEVFSLMSRDDYIYH